MHTTAGAGLTTMLCDPLPHPQSAGATHINVTVADGGLKLLQIKDNGRGIHPDDMPILCHRHTTSKIADFSDLAAISTLGFRGEALCSISFVSRLAVTSMQPGAELGYRAEFRDSEMLSPAPEPCASVQGTCIQVRAPSLLHVLRHGGAPAEPGPERTHGLYSRP